MNSLRKTFLALSLIAVVPAAQAWPNWATWDKVKSVSTDLSTKAFNFSTSVKDCVAKQAPRVSRFAKENPRKTAAGVLGAAVVIGGAGYLAKKYDAASKVRNAAGKAVNAPKNFTKAVYNRFAALSTAKKAGVVIGGTVAVAGAGYLAKLVWNKYNASRTV